MEKLRFDQRRTEATFCVCVGRGFSILLFENVNSTNLEYNFSNWQKILRMTIKKVNLVRILEIGKCQPRIIILLTGSWLYLICQFSKISRRRLLPPLKYNLELDLSWPVLISLNRLYMSVNRILTSFTWVQIRLNDL